MQGVLSVPIHGSIALFLCGTALHLFAVTSLGMFLATFARTMPQFALLMIMVLLPLQMLAGGMTPRESMPEFVQQIMLAAPTTHFVMLAQGILFRGAGLSVVWPQFLALALIGAVLVQYRPRSLPQDHRLDGVGGVMQDTNNLDLTCINTIRTLSMDAVHRTDFRIIAERRRGNNQQRPTPTASRIQPCPNR